MEKKTLPPLPVPTLEETKKRYLTWVRPLLDDNDYRHTEGIVEQFMEKEAPILQKDLQQFAKKQEVVGKSWLSDDWLDSYLQVRKPLPLSTSVALRLDLNLPNNPMTRLAHFIVALGKQSADCLNGQLAESTSPRGEPLDMRQWLLLRGIGRIPQTHCDRYEVAPTEKQIRYIIVFWHDQAYTLPVLDEEHRSYSVVAVSSMLQWIAEQKPSAENNITALSLAPAEMAASLLNNLSQSAVNQDNFQLLARSLFHVHLSPEAFVNDTDALRELAFLANEKLWTYKPLTICANLENNALFAHMEHGSYDAATLQAILSRTEKTAQELDSNTSELFMPIPQPRALLWDISQQQQTELLNIQKAYREKAKNYEVSIMSTSFERQILPEKTSLDFVMQLIIQYAQLKTFGKIRNTYEAVDVSHFQAGRTECIRPVSSESVAFVQALATGKAATLADFNLAHQEHKNRIKACKQGRGVNRHLFGLQLMAKRRGLEVKLFTDKAYTTLTTDFLSTSSLGDRHLIGDFAFSPTTAGGIGVGYFLTDNNDGFLYCLSYNKDQADDIQSFINGLKEGSEKLTTFFSQY